MFAFIDDNESELTDVFALLPPSARPIDASKAIIAAAVANPVQGDDCAATATAVVPAAVAFAASWVTNNDVNAVDCSISDICWAILI